MAKSVNGQQIIQLFEQFSPKAYAVEGDKIGLQIGTLNKPIKNVMVTLDVLESVIDEAIEKEVDLIIAHHPPIFRSLKHISTDQPAGRLIEKCLKHDIAVYAAHTNLDVADGGVNDLLAEALELSETEVLAPTYTDPLKKLAVYVPKEYEEQVRAALGNAGAGHIGEYSHCAFSSEGIGSFKPLDGAKPFIGEVGELELVHEVRLETVFPKSVEKAVINAMIKSHPYEEVAYDIYPVEQTPAEKGLGRVGTLKNEMTLKEFALFVKDKLASGERLSIYPRSDSRKRFCVRCDLHHVFRRCRYSVCGGPRCCFSRGAFTKRLAQSEHWPAGAYIGPCSHHHDKDAEHYGVQTRGLCDGHCKALNRKTN